jgi:hypothetical protein
VQLQAVCSHFFVVVMKAPLRLHAFTRTKALLLGEFIRRSEECGESSLQRFLNAQTRLEFHERPGQSVHFWPSSPYDYEHNQADVGSIRSTQMRPIDHLRSGPRSRPFDPRIGAKLTRTR